MDPAVDELIDTNAQVEPVIKDFFYFTEGIVLGAKARTVGIGYSPRWPRTKS